MYCRNCGANISDDAVFCPNCGQKTSDSDFSDKAKEAVNGVVNMVNDTEKEIEGVVNDVTDRINSTMSGGPVSEGPLKTDRGLASYIILSIITCGIYSYYFIYSIAKDVNSACQGDGNNTVGLGMFILLSIVTCGIYAWFWYYSLGNRLADNAPRYGLSFQENGTTILLWLIFGSLICGIGPYVAMYILIKNTNAICVAYNNKCGYYGA